MIWANIVLAILQLIFIYLVIQKSRQQFIDLARLIHRHDRRMEGNVVVLTEQHTQQVSQFKERIDHIDHEHQQYQQRIEKNLTKIGSDFEKISLDFGTLPKWLFELNPEDKTHGAAAAHR